MESVLLNLHNSITDLWGSFWSKVEANGDPLIKRTLGNGAGTKHKEENIIEKPGAGMSMCISQVMFRGAICSQGTFLETQADRVLTLCRRFLSIMIARRT